MTLTRQEIALEDQWDLTPLFLNDSDWEKAFPLTLPDFSKFKGRLGEHPEVLAETLKLSFSTLRELEKLYTYAHLKHDEDISNENGKQKYSKILNLFQDFSISRSWIEPEILSLPDHLLNQYLKEISLEPYSFYLKTLLHMKPFVLDEKGEAIIAQASQIQQTAPKAFRALSDGDLKFGTIFDSEGDEHVLTHASYGVFLRSSDRKLRKEAFTQLHKKYADFHNTLGELYSGAVQNHVFVARARGFQTSLEAALHPLNIPTKVYHTLIDIVNSHLKVHHDYLSLRKNLLGVESFHLYDVYAPLVQGEDETISYEEAVSIIIESVAPLGKQYQDTLADGLKKKRWVDKFENQNKRSGAYSSGCYDSPPYILMNYKGTFRDLSTLAHEAGHSMHSYLSRKGQPYETSDYSIFVAEVASTLNEALLFDYLMKQTKDPLKKRYLINQKLDDIRATFFRQTMFAEFELKTHSLAEKGHPLTAEGLNKIYHELNQKYFGQGTTLDSFGEYEWSRIPHFYSNFYVYQYATGISAAFLFAKKILSGDQREKERYLSFLKSGGSDYPVELLKKSGVDMSDEQSFLSTLDYFSELTSNLAVSK